MKKSNSSKNTSSIKKPVSRSKSTGPQFKPKPVILDTAKDSELKEAKVVELKSVRKGLVMPKTQKVIEDKKSNFKSSNNSKASVVLADVISKQFQDKKVVASSTLETENEALQPVSKPKKTTTDSETTISMSKIVVPNPSVTSSQFVGVPVFKVCP